MGLYSKIWRLDAKKTTPAGPLYGPSFSILLQILSPTLHSWRSSISPSKHGTHYFSFSFLIFLSFSPPRPPAPPYSRAAPPPTSPPNPPTVHGRCRRSTSGGSALRSAGVGASSWPQLGARRRGAVGRPPDPRPVLSSYPSTPSHGQRRWPQRGCRRVVGRGAAVREHPHRRRRH
jgi:hypothetical protein